VGSSATSGPISQTVKINISNVFAVLAVISGWLMFWKLQNNIHVFGILNFVLS